MPEDYFENGPQTDAPAPAENGGNDDKEEKGDHPTFLINSEVCPDMKPGDMMELRIVGVHDGEYEVAYEEKGKDERSEESPEPASMPAWGGPPDSMMD